MKVNRLDMQFQDFRVLFIVIIHLIYGQYALLQAVTQILDSFHYSSSGGFTRY